jgi:hypothetical protein
MERSEIRGRLACLAIPGLRGVDPWARRMNLLQISGHPY